MPLKYILLFFFLLSMPASAQMPNLRDNATNAPTDPTAAATAAPSSASSPSRPVQPSFKSDEGNLYLGYGDIDYSRTLGGQQLCHISIRLKNKTAYTLKRLNVKFTWPSWTNPVKFTNFRPEEENSITYRIPGDACNRINEKPRIAVTDCSIADKDIGECGKMIKVIPLAEFSDIR